MTQEISLYTPLTGYPELEAKIAYGLAKVGVESAEVESITIEPLGGCYKITINGTKDKLESAFNTIMHRLFSSKFIPLNTPGVTSRTALTLTTQKNEKFELDDYFKLPAINFKNQTNEPVCRHGKNTVSAVIGLTASTSYHHERDYINVDNKKENGEIHKTHRPTNPKEICKTCALLALLGTWSTTFIFNIKDQEVVITPILKQKLGGAQLIKLFSIQHQLRNIKMTADIPSTLIPILVLSKIPSNLEVLKDFDLHIAVLTRPQGYHVDSLYIGATGKYIEYLNNNSYNIAAIDNMFENNAIEALSVLNNLLITRRKDMLLKFARVYVSQTSSDNWINLMYYQTAKYLSEEVCMINKDIINNKAISSLAQTLRYFVKERKYHYADDLRNSRKDSKDFEETIVKMLREARLRKEQDDKIHLPNDEEIKEIFNLAQDNFDDVKTSIVLLALAG
ncbi:MAG: type I-A CRISPR-associated protein Csa5 [candidate division WOR-3 bacterium]|nr:type I-A CRISPR-associated protein Csa5 [candidate division WOR-3 bacterium]